MRLFWCTDGIPLLLENMESFGWPGQPMMFQTGSRRPVVISGRSIERSRGVLEEGDTEKSGKIGLLVFLKKKAWNICLLIFLNSGKKYYF